MLKLEMKFNDEKLLNDAKYSQSSIYEQVDSTFSKYCFRKEKLQDGSICYYGNGQAKDYGIFGKIITTLKDKEWFMTYLIKWLWYNSDESENEEEYVIEDVLYHYTNKESIA